MGNQKIYLKGKIPLDYEQIYKLPFTLSKVINSANKIEKKNYPIRLLNVQFNVKSFMYFKDRNKKLKLVQVFTGTCTLLQLSI